jgi:hypothetical protein
MVQSVVVGWVERAEWSMQSELAAVAFSTLFFSRLVDRFLIGS